MASDPSIFMAEQGDNTLECLVQSGVEACTRRWFQHIIEESMNAQDRSLERRLDHGILSHDSENPLSKPMDKDHDYKNKSMPESPAIKRDESVVEIRVHQEK